jgi:hypothetical protein
MSLKIGEQHSGGVFFLQCGCYEDGEQDQPLDV